MSEQLPPPLKTVCRVAGVSRSSAQEQRRRRSASAKVTLRRRPGPVGPLGDAELLREIRAVLEESPFTGEGHRKVWARLARKGVRTARKRVLRLTREAGLLAPTPEVRKRAKRLHEGTITVTDELGGTRRLHPRERRQPRLQGQRLHGPVFAPDDEEDRGIKPPRCSSWPGRSPAAMIGTSVTMSFRS